MEQPFIIIDSNKKELFAYEDESFPFGIYRDRLALFPQKHLPIHWHDSFEFDLVLSGTVEFSVEDQVIQLNSGEAIFINMNMLHSATQISTENAIMLVFVFQPRIFGGETIYRNNIKDIYESGMTGIKITSETEAEKLIIGTLRSFENLSIGENGYEMLVLEKLARLWYCLHNNILHLHSFPLRKKISIGRAEQLKQMLIYVQENYMKKISIECLAKSANIGRTECFKRFKEYMNTTPNEYITNYRLIQAEKMLMSSDASIITISNDCGFSSQSYFGRLFKEKYGVSPMVFRRKMER